MAEISPDVLTSNASSTRGSEPPSSPADRTPPSLPPMTPVNGDVINGFDQSEARSLASRDSTADARHPSAPGSETPTTSARVGKALEAPRVPPETRTAPADGKVLVRDGDASEAAAVGEAAREREQRTIPSVFNGNLDGPFRSRERESSPKPINDETSASSSSRVRKLENGMPSRSDDGTTSSTTEETFGSPGQKTAPLDFGRGKDDSVVAASSSTGDASPESHWAGGDVACQEEVVDRDWNYDDDESSTDVDHRTSNAVTTVSSSETVVTSRDSAAMNEREYELSQMRKLVREIISDHYKSSNWPFLDPVDVEALKLWDYPERVKKPMWLKKIRDKAENDGYATFGEMVSDFRLMLENCYRYNGPDHFISKRGQRLEQVFEQKISLLAKSLREKASVELTNPDWLGDEAVPSEFGLRRRTKTGGGVTGGVVVGGVDTSLPSATLLANLRAIQDEQEREKKKSALIEKRQQVEAKWQTIQQWEEDLVSSEVRLQMKHMPELPQIGLFLYLCQSALNLPELNQFDVERCCIVPKQSQSMSYIMTSLLSTPYQRKDLDRKPPMPYRVWESKLKKRVGLWYHQSRDRNSGLINILKAQYQLGLDPTFFDILGAHANPMEKHQFHELSFFQRVWILKALCDNCLESQSHLRESIELNHVSDQREVLLGVDAQGNFYIHFPQFCGADLRVYKMVPAPWPELDKVSKKQLRETEEAAEARTASNLAYQKAPSRKRKELLKKIRAKIKEQNQYEKQRKMELKMAERRRKMEEKMKRRQEREAAKGPRPSGLRQSIKAILKPEDMNNAIESSASESSFSSDEDDEDEDVDNLLGSSIPFDVPLPEEMPIEDDEEEAPGMLFGDSEEEDEEEEQEEEDENDSDWDMKKEKKKGGRKSWSGSGAAAKKRSKREEEDSRDESGANEEEEEITGRRRKRRSVVARQRRKRDEPESEEEEEEEVVAAPKKRKGRKSAILRDEDAEESDKTTKGRKGNSNKNSAATSKSLKKGKKVAGKKVDSEEETEGEAEERDAAAAKSARGHRRSTTSNKLTKKKPLSEDETEDDDSVAGSRIRKKGKASAKSASKASSATKGRGSNKKNVSSSKAESETSAAETDEGTDFEAAAASSTTTTTTTRTATAATALATSALSTVGTEAVSSHATEATGRGRRKKSLARRLAAADQNDSDSSVSTTTTSASKDKKSNPALPSTRRESMRKSVRDRKTPRKFSPTSSCASTRSLSKDLDAVSNVDSASNLDAPAASDSLVDYEADDDSRFSVNENNNKMAASSVVDAKDEDGGSANLAEKKEKLNRTTAAAPKNKVDKTTVWSFITEMAQENDGGAVGSVVEKGMTIEDVEKAFEKSPKKGKTDSSRATTVPEEDQNAETEREATPSAEGAFAAKDFVTPAAAAAAETAVDAAADSTVPSDVKPGATDDGTPTAPRADCSKDDDGDVKPEVSLHVKVEDMVKVESANAEEALINVSSVKKENVHDGDMAAERESGDPVDRKPSAAAKVEDDGEMREDGTREDATGSPSDNNNLVIPTNYVGPIEAEIPPPKITSPDLTSFELVADSIDSLKDLIRKLKKDPTWEPIVKDEDDDEEGEGKEVKGEEGKEVKGEEGKEATSTEKGNKESAGEGKDDDDDKTNQSKTSTPTLDFAKMDGDSDAADADDNNSVNPPKSKSDGGGGGGKASAKSPEEKREWELLEKLEDLLTELAPFERKLNDASRRMRLKLQKEVIEYKEVKMEDGGEGNAAWDSDIDDDDEIRNNTPSLSYDDNSNDPYYVGGGGGGPSGGEMATDGGGRSLRANPRPSKRKLEMDRENALILQGVQDEYTDLCRSEEFDIVEVSSRGRVRKVRRLGISEEHERSSNNGGGSKDPATGGATPKTASGRPARTGSRKSTPMMGDDYDDDDDLLDEENNSNSSFALESVAGGSSGGGATPQHELSVHERRSLASKKAAKTRAANQLQRQLAEAAQQQQQQEGGFVTLAAAPGKNSYATPHGGGGLKKPSAKKDPEEVSREILANSKLNAAITTYKETGKLPEGMQFAGRGADGKPIVICAESIEQIKHLDNYKILTTLLTQKGKADDEKSFDGYATASKESVRINPEIIYKSKSSTPFTGKTIIVNAAQFANATQHHQIVKQQQQQQQQQQAVGDTGRVNRMEIKPKKGAAPDADSSGKRTAISTNCASPQPQLLQRVVAGQPGSDVEKQQMTPLQIGELLNKKFNKQNDGDKPTTPRGPVVVGVPGGNAVQLIQARPGGQQQRFVVCSSGNQQIVTINGQQHILVQQQLAPSSTSLPQQQPPVCQTQQPKPIQPMLHSQPQLITTAEGNKISPSPGGGFIVVRPTGAAAAAAVAQTVASNPASAAAVAAAQTASTQIVQTAGGSIILQQPVSPQSTPQQPIIASVRLPNGQTQQILLNTQQVMAHQQLAQLQAMNASSTKQHRLIAPSPLATAPRASSAAASSTSVVPAAAGATLPPPQQQQQQQQQPTTAQQQQLVTIPSGDGLGGGGGPQQSAQIVRYVTPKGHAQAVQVIPVQQQQQPPTSQTIQRQPQPAVVVPVVGPASSSSAPPIISIPSSNPSVSAIVNNNKPPVPARCVTVRNLLENRRKTTLTPPSDSANPSATAETTSTAAFPDSVSPVPDVVATQIMTNVVKPAAVSVAAVSNAPRDVTALTQSVTGPIPAVKPNASAASAAVPARSNAPATPATPRQVNPTQKVTFKIAVPPNQLQQIPGKGFVTPQGVVLNPAALQQAIGTQVLQHAALTGEPIVLDEERLARILAIQKEQQQLKTPVAMQNGASSSTPLQTERASSIKSPLPQMQQQIQEQQQLLPQKQTSPAHALEKRVNAQPQQSQQFIVQSPTAQNVVLKSPLKSPAGVSMKQLNQPSPPQRLQTPQPSQQLHVIQPQQQLTQVVPESGVQVAQGVAIAAATPTFQVIAPTKEQMTQAASHATQQGKVVLLNVGGRLVPVQAVTTPPHQALPSQQQVSPVQQLPPQQTVMLQQPRVPAGAASSSPVKLVQIVSSEPAKTAGVPGSGKCIQLTKEQLANLTPAQLDQLKQLIPNASVVE